MGSTKINEKAFLNLAPMKTELNVSSDMLTWAISRAGYELAVFIDKFPNVQKWIAGERKPTVKQLEDFSRKVHVPFGYLFLQEPPKEKLPITFFRTNGNPTDEASLNVYDTILLLQQRQDWLQDYLKDNDFMHLPYVGKYQNSHDVKAIVQDIRSILGLAENWASQFKTWQEAQDHLVLHIEDIGIITVFNGVVENNTTRPINVDECRGFVLVNPMAPFMFINNADFKSAQMFTIVHELAHIWIGKSAGFDFRNLQPADNPGEVLCDKVAAEFLVPENAFNALWANHPNINYASRFFKVSEIVIARRALDTRKISKSEFLAFYTEYSNREFVKKDTQASGGNFYATVKRRISKTFATHVNNAVKSGKLLYRDAYKLTSLKGDTYQTFFTEHM